VLGDFFPPDRYVPNLPQFPNHNFGPGDFLWEPMDLRTMFDRSGRGDGPGSRQMHVQCSGLIGLDATESAISEGFPPGIPDPTGYDPSRTAFWFNDWMGVGNVAGWPGANAPISHPPLSFAGLDTLYTYVSNSWAWENGDLYEACGTAYLSPLEGEPVVLRYHDPASPQGKIVWCGAPLHIFDENHMDDLKLLMRRLTDWIFLE